MTPITIKTHTPNLLIAEINASPNTNELGERQITVQIPGNERWTETTLINQDIVNLTNECLLIKQSKEKLARSSNSWVRRYSNTLNQNSSGFSSFFRMLGRIFLSPLSSIREIKHLDHQISQHQQQAAHHAAHLARELSQLEQRLVLPSQETEQPRHGEPLPRNENDKPSVMEEFEELFDYDRQGPYANLIKEIQRRVAITRLVHTVPGFYLANTP